MIKKTIFFLSVAFGFAPNFLNAQVSNQERLFADRVAILAIDGKCALFSPTERRALNAFMLQSRGQLLRQNVADARLRLLSAQAKNGALSRACDETVVVNEVLRIKKAYQSWRLQMNAEFPGIQRSWKASRAGLDNWRAWQEIGDGVRAGFVLAQNGLAFGVETPVTNIATMRVYYRNAARIGLPKSNSNLQPPPRVGTDTLNAAALVPAQTKKTVDGAPRMGVLAIFPNQVTKAIIGLDPRDCFEVELIDRSGNAKAYIVEVGDIIAAFALGAEI